MSSFLTLSSVSIYEYREKSSKFIAYAIPVFNDLDIDAQLNDLKRKYFDATHICYAYKLGSIYKFYDDREPKGSAGIRILNAINSLNLNFVLVCVIRYFGGIKLGIGPLGNAYYNAALWALKLGNIVKRNIYLKIKITFSNNNFFNNIYKILSTIKAKILSNNYDKYFAIDLIIDQDDFDRFISYLRSYPSNEYELSILDDKIIL